MTRVREWISSALLAGTLLFVNAAAAETRHYVIAIGNNELPAGQKNDADNGAGTLHYADDDAAAVASFAHELGAQTTLLTVLDIDSQQRFPGLANVATPPTLAELRRVVGQYRQRFETDVHEGNDPVLILFYSGHGVVRSGEPPSLSMLDGPLTRAILYDEILAKLPARYVHLIVDACHAEAVVRPRDAQAEVTPVSDSELSDYAARSTLRRFPNVGAVIATSSASEAHEWDVYQRGIFTYQVLSGLRGAADVNGDGLVEYSELSAFLGSVNAEVADPRAKLSVVVHAPAVNPRAPIADLSPMRHRGAVLTGVGPGLGRFFVEDERGNRLGEMLPERGFRFQLHVPSGEPLFVRTATGESAIQLEPGARLAMSTLHVTPTAMRTRGAMETSLRHGLFAMPFGPTYYRGFVDARPELPPVAMNAFGEGATGAEGDSSGSPTTARTIGWVLGGVGVAGIAVGAVFGLKFISENSEVGGICPTYTLCDAQDAQRYNTAVAEAKTDRTISIAAFSAGGAALVSGGALLLLTTRKPNETALGIEPSLGRGLIGATMEGAW